MSVHMCAIVIWPGSTNYSTCPAVMPSPQKRGKHLASRILPTRQTSWNNNHRSTPDGEVQSTDGTTNMTRPNWTLKKECIVVLFYLYINMYVQMLVNQRYSTYEYRILSSQKTLDHQWLLSNKSIHGHQTHLINQNRRLTQARRT